MKHFELCNQILSGKSIEQSKLIEFFADFVEKKKAPNELLTFLIQGVRFVSFPELIYQYYDDNPNVLFATITHNNYIIKNFIYLENK